MASIINDPGGKRRIQFVSTDGLRKAIRLGKVSQRHAEGFKLRVEQILETSLMGRSMEADLIKWIHGQLPQMQKKLGNVGLIPKVEHAKVVTLAEFLSDYIAKHGPTVKPNTLITWKQCQRLLLEHFKPATPLRDINEGRAIEWRNYLKTRPHERIKRARKLEETTIRKRCACARQFFEQAVRLELLSSNPFKSKRIPTSLPKAKQKAFILPEDARSIINHLPNDEWRLLFAFARWGGLRIPSEPARLKWSDIDWNRHRIVIHSPKTEHHEGHENRVIPLFPELRLYLDKMRDQSPEDQLFVLPMLQRGTAAALRKPVIKAIEAAGLEIWEKLFVSLRATRDTELRETFPVHVVEAWLGHEDRVAKKNYTQVTDQHFGLGAETLESGHPKVTQKAAQQARETATQGVASESDRHKKTPQNAGSCTNLLDGAKSSGGDDRN